MMPQPMGRVQSQGMMRAFGVVPQQPVEEFVVEGLEIGEQKLFVIQACRYARDAFRPSCPRNALASRDK